MTDNARTIDGFIHWFRSHLHAIAMLDAKNPGYEQKVVDYKKTLMSSLIDSMAKSIYPSVNGNKKRYILFIDEHSSWENRDRVSLPHLAKWLENKDDYSFERVKQFVKDRFRWDHGSLISLEHDPLYEEVYNVWPVNEVAVEGGSKLGSLKRMTHKSLFYENRNSLVHELEENGYGFEVGTHYPHYMSVTDLRNKVTVFNLNYPLRFYEDMCVNCINSVEVYFKDRKLDPYGNLVFGDYWIDELNLS